MVEWKKKQYIDKFKLVFGGKRKKIQIIDKFNLVFEGEYIIGKWSNGKGKKCYKNGELVFEGDFLDAKWNGMEKEKNIIMKMN